MGKKGILVLAFVFGISCVLFGCKSNETAVVTGTFESTIPSTPDVSPIPALNEFNAVFMGFVDENGKFGGSLMGAADNGEWLGLFDKPITIDDKDIDEDSDFLEILQDEQEHKIKSQMVTQGSRYSIYCASGNIGEVVNNEPLRFDYFSASGQLFLNTDFEAEKPLKLDHGVCIAISSDHNAMPRATEHFEEEGVISYSADIDGQGNVVVAKYVKQENGYYSIELDNNHKPQLIIADYSVDPEELGVFFIDIDGDGIMELAEYLGGPAGYFSVSRITSGGLERLLIIDLGE